MDASRDNNNSGICRLCLSTPNKTTSLCSINLNLCGEISALVKEVYAIEVLPGDHTQSLCVACYQKTISSYNYIVQHRNKKRVFHLNQLVLSAQANAAAVREDDDLTGAHRQLTDRAVSVTLSTTTSGADSSSAQEEVVPPNDTARKKVTSGASVRPTSKKNLSFTRSVPTMEPAVDRSVKVAHPEPHPDKRQVPSSASRVQKSAERNDTTPVAPYAKPAKQTPENTSSSSSFKTLVPLVMDCMAEPQYFEALWPIKATVDHDDIKPLLYLCDSCYFTFKTEDEFNHHRAQKCTPACRYCYMQIKSHHNCAFRTKYSFLERFIKGTTRYVTTPRPETVKAGASAEGTSSKTPPISGDQKAGGKRPSNGQQKANEPRSSRKSTSAPKSKTYLSPELCDSSEGSSSVSPDDDTITVDDSDETVEIFINNMRKHLKKKVLHLYKITDDD